MRAMRVFQGLYMVCSRYGPHLRKKSELGLFGPNWSEKGSNLQILYQISIVEALCMVFINVLQGCFIDGVSIKLQGCYKSDTWVSQMCLLVCHKCVYLGVTSVFTWVS